LSARGINTFHWIFGMWLYKLVISRGRSSHRATFIYLWIVLRCACLRNNETREWNFSWLLSVSLLLFCQCCRNIKCVSPGYFTKVLLIVNCNIPQKFDSSQSTVFGHRDFKGKQKAIVEAAVAGGCLFISSFAWILKRHVFLWIQGEMYLFLLLREWERYASEVYCSCQAANTLIVCRVCASSYRLSWQKLVLPLLFLRYAVSIRELVCRWL